MEKQIRFRKQSLILSSVALATIFAGTVSADETATTTPATPATTTGRHLNQQQLKYLLPKQLKKLKAKANTPVIPLENAKELGGML